MHHPACRAAGARKHGLFFEIRGLANADCVQAARFGCKLGERFLGAVFLRSPKLTTGEQLEVTVVRSVTDMQNGAPDEGEFSLVASFHRQVPSVAIAGPQHGYEIVLSLSERRRSITEQLQKAAPMEAGAKIRASSRSLGADVAPGQDADAPLNRLSQVLDLTQAQNLRDTVAALLNDGPVLLDASAVERMSTPCAQVLLAAGRAADLAGSSFQIIDASEVFRTALADLGLQTEFRNWVV